MVTQRWRIQFSCLSFVPVFVFILILVFCLFVGSFVHPRFGQIKCIRTLRAVQKEEELTVAYGYDHKPTGQNDPEAPDWYKQELEAFQQQQHHPPGGQWRHIRLPGILVHCGSWSPAWMEAAFRTKLHKNYARNQNNLTFQMFLMFSRVTNNSTWHFQCLSFQA